MIRLGEKQTLVIVKKVEFGVYLAASEKEAEDRVLLPARQVPENSGIGDELEVFVYRDSKDRLIATTRTPKLMMGQVAELKVAQTGKFGAFLDWGLEKDLMLPFKQQTRRVREGEDVLVSLYIEMCIRDSIKTLEYEGTQGLSDSSYAAWKWVIGNTKYAYLNQGCIEGDRCV